MRSWRRSGLRVGGRGGATEGARLPTGAESMPAHWLTATIVVETGDMHGYTASTYGDAFADVYDDWYHDIDDLPVAIAALAALAPDGAAVLELGVGTGRIAVPLAAALEGRCGPVVGLDTSDAMLRRLHDNDRARLVRPHLGDMVDGLPAGPFGLVVVAYNTFFNLLTEQRQAACFREVAARLGPRGSFVVDAFVPTDDDVPSRVGVRSLSAGRVVLSVSIGRPADQLAEGQYIDITEAGGVRLRPWAIRYASPAQLDAMAAEAGLRLVSRTESYDGAPFGEHSPRHISVYAA